MGYLWGTGHLSKADVYGRSRLTADNQISRQRSSKLYGLALRHLNSPAWSGLQRQVRWSDGLGIVDQ